MLRTMLDASLDHAAFMQEALQEARKALATEDVPVGAVVVFDGLIIGRGHNQREALTDPTAHAEILALQQAARHLSSWRLIDTVLYVTLEPCIMCIGAAVLGRISGLVYGCHDPKAGACGSQFDILGAQRLNHTFPIVSGVCESEASALLKTFFRQLRQRRKLSIRGQNRL
ncbi:MAG: adenosine deaminase [Candidatus Entotheonella factor]|uniref:tRNA-specific adenosine deaminase n=1 Tax=Entotheonella factor TaxID=1429438 RepID=W4LN52_ENTF1|nr:MAG: adenosine deaminase [Candidatus Entotheonella factor]